MGELWQRRPDIQPPLEPRERAKELMRTPNWHTEALLHLQASAVELVAVERDLREPAEARSVRLVTWHGKLLERGHAIREANPQASLLIQNDVEGENATNFPALFERTSDGSLNRKMWSGTTVTLAQEGAKITDEKAEIRVNPISYSEWIACYNPEYAEAFKKDGLPLPYAGIGISVLMETVDGFMPLTRRGIETPVYPGRLYSPGGGPKPWQSSTESLLEEIVEETGLKNGIHFLPEEMTMLALVSDSRFAGSQHSRPELVAYLPVHVSFHEMERIQHQQALKKGRETDVWALEAFSAYPPSFRRKLVYGGAEMCPSTEAGLAHTLLYKAAQEKGLDAALTEVEPVMKQLNGYGRSEYIPLIKGFSS